MKSTAAVLILAMLGVPAVANGAATHPRAADTEFASRLDTPESGAQGTRSHRAERAQPAAAADAAP